MNKKLAVLLIVCLVSSIGIPTAAKPPQVPPETPSLLELVNELKATVAGLQTSVSDLWLNATAQQSQISELWENATEQQNAIDAIQPGSTVSFGNWITHDQDNYPFIEGITYQAETDGFVCAYATGMWSEGLVTIRGSSGPSLTTMQTRIYSHAYQNTTGGIAEPGGITMPVRAGEYWKVDMPAIWSSAGTPNIQFIPLTP